MDSDNNPALRPAAHPPTGPLSIPAAPSDAAYQAAVKTKVQNPEPLYLTPHAVQLLLGQWAHGVVLLASQSRVVFANASARVQLAHNPWLRLNGEQLLVKQSSDQSALQEQLLAAYCGEQGFVQMGLPSAVKPGRSGGKKSPGHIGAPPPLAIAVLPLTDLGLAQGPGVTSPITPATAQVALVLGRTELCESGMLAHFARQHRLTAGEEAVLRALSHESDAQAIARHLGIAPSTVRSHLKSISQKTGSRGMRELQARLAALPPIHSQLTTSLHLDLPRGKGSISRRISSMQ